MRKISTKFRFVKVESAVLAQNSSHIRVYVCSLVCFLGMLKGFWDGVHPGGSSFFPAEVTV